MASKHVTIGNMQEAIESGTVPGQFNAGRTEFIFPTITYIGVRGETRTWTIRVSIHHIDGSGPAEITPEFLSMPAVELIGLQAETVVDAQQVGGKIRDTVSTFTSAGKNLGRANATNAITQAIRMALSKYNKKLKGTALVSAVSGVGEFDAMPPPMLVKKINESKASTLTDVDFENGVTLQPKLNGVHLVVCGVAGTNPDEPELKIMMYSRTSREYPGHEQVKSELLPLLTNPPPIVAGYYGVPGDVKIVAAYTDPRPYFAGELYAHGKGLEWISGQARKTDDDGDLNFHIFDVFFPHAIAAGHDMESKYRQLYISDFLAGGITPHVTRVPNTIADDIDHVHEFAKQCLKNGYEGAIARKDVCGYRYGYSNYHSANLVKIKPVFDAEFKIVGYTAGTKGKNLGSVIWECEVPNPIDPSDARFTVVPKGLTYPEMKKIYVNLSKVVKDSNGDMITRFERDIKGLPLTVEYRDVSSKTGKPQQAKALTVRSYESGPKLDPMRALLLDDSEINVSGGGTGSGAWSGVKIVVADDLTTAKQSYVESLRDAFTKAGAPKVMIVKVSEYAAGNSMYERPCSMIVFLSHVVPPPAGFVHRSATAFLLLGESDKILTADDTLALKSLTVKAIYTTKVQPPMLRILNVWAQFIDHVNGIADLWAAPRELSAAAAAEAITSAKFYKVGESTFTKIPPGPDTPNYDDDYVFLVNAADIIVQDSLKKGVPFEKNQTAVMSAYIQPGSYVLDIGTNVGTVAIPLSRAVGGDVTIFGFEPFPPTWTLMNENLKRNNCTNVIPHPVAVGHETRAVVTLSGEVFAPPEITRYDPSSKKLTIADGNANKHLGAVQLGVGGNEVRMVTIDSLVRPDNHVSLMKVDIEGAEPLAMYGARETIRRCMPVISYERNENVITPDMRSSMNIPDEVAEFEITVFCYELGYRDLYEIEFGNYMLVPPGREMTTPNSIHKFNPVNRITNHPPHTTKGYNLHKFQRPRWNAPAKRGKHSKRGRGECRVSERSGGGRNNSKNHGNKSNSHSWRAAPAARHKQKPRSQRSDPLITEKKIYSQNGEDGVLASIFQILGPGNKYYVEFGCEDGSERNTRGLDVMGWKGLLMDGSHYNPAINLQKEFITVENIQSLFAKYNVPREHDLLSIDIDGNDYYVWDRLCRAGPRPAGEIQYRPRVVVIEYNAALAPPRDAIVTYDPNFIWKKRSIYFGASICALTRLGRSLGYTLVYVESRGINLFFARTDLVQDGMFSKVGDAVAMYVKPSYGPNNAGWVIPPPHGSKWNESQDITEIFKRVIVCGDCDLADRLRAYCCRFNNNQIVINGSMRGAPRNACRILIYVRGARQWPGVAAHTFVIGTGTGPDSLVIGRLAFGAKSTSTPIEEVEFELEDNISMLLEYPTSLGVKSRYDICENYVLDAAAHMVGELAYSGNIGVKNYDAEYVMSVAATDITIQRALAKHSLFDKEVCAALSPYARRPNTGAASYVFDVGGNIGCVGIPLSRETDFVIAFEPLERTFVLYETNIINNHAYNTIVVYGAVGDKMRDSVTLSSHVDLPARQRGRIAAGVREELNPNEPSEFGGVRLGEGGQVTQMITLDRVTSMLPPNSVVAAMKVDVEGAESLVFAGAVKTIQAHSPVVVFEHNERKVDSEMMRGIGSTAAPKLSPLDAILEAGDYNGINKLRLEDYLIMPKNVTPAYIDPAVRYNVITSLPEFAESLTGLSLGKMKSLY